MYNSTLCYVLRGNDVLMLHRVKKKNDINKDKWIGIGGKFEKNESPDECLLREAMEETGLKLTSWRCRGIVTFSTGRTLRPFEAPASMSLTFLDAYTGETYHVAASRAKGGAGHALFADAPFSDPAQMIRQLVERLFPERTDHE